MTTSVLPSFSLEELVSGSRRNEVREVLARAGVFYLTGSGISEDEHSAARYEILDFLTDGTPEQLAAATAPDPRVRRGFTALESESTAAITNTGKYTDYSMSFSMGQTENLFPTERVESVWTGYFAHTYEVTKQVAKAVLDAADANLDEPVDDFVECEPLLRFRYFPEVPEDRVAEEEPLRMAPHYDLSIVTLIKQTPCPNGFVSLRVKYGEEFVPVPAEPGAMLVFCGAIATIVTEGRAISPHHHVAAPGAGERVGSERTSSVFFLRPRGVFEFDVPLARRLGFDASVEGERATFAEWIGDNYVNIRKRASA